VVRQNYGVGPTAQPEIQELFKGAAQVLASAGVTFHEAVLPDLPMEEAAFNIVSSESASALEDIARTKDQLDAVIDPSMRGALVANQVIPAVDYLRSLRIRALAQDALADLYSKYHVLAAPSMTQVAPQADADLDEYFVGGDGQISALGNMLGLPAITLPIGFGHGHMPVGMQLVGPPLSEDMLFALGSAYQSVTGWHQQIPPLFATGV
jgi:aspartyl-tRNA(Asn)/glutamyl-tRNA(Gln) amidotransferase subunit A